MKVLRCLLFSYLLLLLHPNIGRTQWIQTGGPPEPIQCFAVSDTILFAGTADSGVFRSTDNGSVWTRRRLEPSQAYEAILGLYVHPSGVVLAANQSQRMFRSTDNGDSWTAVTSLVGDFLAFVTDSHGQVFTAGNTIYISTDTGYTWQSSAMGITCGPLYSLCRTSNDFLFVGSSGCGIYGSTNGGTLWTQTVLSTGDVKALAVSSSDVIFAATNGHGIWYSTDYGINWNLTGTGNSGNFESIIVTSGGYIFASGYFQDTSGVFRSSDNGASWTEVNTGFTNTQVTALALSGTNLFVGIHDGSVWRRPLSELIPPPLPPHLSQPDSGSINQPPNLSIRWHPSLTSGSYRLEISTDSNFISDIYLNDSTLIDTFKSVSELVNNTKYYWRVSAKNASGTSGWSNIWNFTTTPTMYGDGSLDTTFGVNGVVISGYWNYVHTILIQDDQKIVLCGYDDAGGNNLIVRYNNNGSLDSSFGTNGEINSGISGRGNALAIQSDGKIVVSGDRPILTQVDLIAARYNSDGKPDNTFGSGGQTIIPMGTSWSSNSIKIQQDQKIIVVGSTYDGTHLIFALVRLNRDGSTDNTFGTNGIVKTAVGTLDQEASGVDLQADNKIVAVGEINDGVTRRIILVRYQANGMLDSTFGADGFVFSQPSVRHIYKSIKIQPDGKILVVGVSPGPPRHGFVLRFKNDGILDSTFNSTGSITLSAVDNGDFNSLSIQKDVKILLVGYAALNLKYVSFIFRLNTDGTLDNKFGDNGLVLSSVGDGDFQAWDIASQADGKLILAGNSSSVAGSGAYYMTMVRYLSSIEIPIKPNLFYPPNNAQDHPANIKFVWSESQSATSYRLEVCTDSSFISSILVDDSTLSDTFKTVNSLLNNTTYFWRVRAKNGGGVSAWSDAWSFTTIIAAPAVPILLSPVFQPSTVRISWQRSARAETYRVQLTTDSNFVTGISIDDSTLADTFKVAGGLTYNTAYFWRVRAKNRGGMSTWSGIGRFTTISIAPQAPILLSPAFDTTNQPVNPTVSWRRSILAVTYHLQMTADSNFIVGFIANDSTLVDTAKSITGLVNNKRYFWRVRAINQSGTSGWSPTWKFTTLAIPPTVQNVAIGHNIAEISLDGQANPNGSPTLAWFEWGTDSQFIQRDSTVKTNLGSGTSIVAFVVTLPNLLLNTTYYFRAVAENVAGRAYANTDNFTTPHVPIMTTGPSFAGADTAMIGGFLNDDGWFSSSIWFEWGTDSSLAVRDSTAKIPFTGGRRDTVVTAILKNLLPYTKYYYRVVGQSAVGRGKGMIKNFSTLLPPYPATFLLNDTLSFPAHPNADDYTASDYRIIGLPGNSNLPVTDFLTGGSRKDWKVYWDNGWASNYLDYYDASPKFRFTTGRAFWVLAKSNFKINMSVPSAPLDTVKSVNIPLQTGWNLIANPFPGMVPWTIVQALNSISDSIYTFNHGFTTSSSFDPFIGYYLFNSQNLISLKIPWAGLFTPLIPLKTQEAMNWNVNIVMTSRTTVDKSVCLGVSKDATNTLDRFKQRKPRAVDLMPSVYFDRSAWDKDYPTFTSDLRAVFKDSCTWPFNVQTDRKSTVSLEFRRIASVPADLEIFVIDRTGSTYADIRKDSVYKFTAMFLVHHFEVVVGKHDLLINKLKSVIPRDYALGNIFPNPFNPSTTVPVSVPYPSEVKLTVYNILGQEIDVIYRGKLDAGQHWFIWNTKTVTGTQLSSGVYIIQLKTTDGFRSAKKILLMR